AHPLLHPLLSARSERAGEPDVRALPGVGERRPRGPRRDLRAEPSAREAVRGLPPLLVSPRRRRRHSRPPRLDASAAESGRLLAHREFPVVRADRRVAGLAARPLRRRRWDLAAVLLRGGDVAVHPRPPDTVGLRVARPLAGVDSRGGRDEAIAGAQTP